MGETNRQTKAIEEEMRNESEFALTPGRNQQSPCETQDNQWPRSNIDHKKHALYRQQIGRAHV